MPRILTFTASGEDKGRTVGEVIRSRWRLVAHDMARAKYRTCGGITVNGEQAMVNRRLVPGDELKVVLDNEMPSKIVPVRGPLEILYEDEDLIALNKPSGVVVHPSHGHFADTLANYLAQYYLDCGDPHEVRTVGRLDKDTSGVILFGKSRTVCAHLAGQTEKAGRGRGRAGDGSGGHAEGGCGEARDAALREKVYLAAAEGRFDCREGIVDAPISREYEDKIRRVVREDGDFALTRYRVLEEIPAPSGVFTLLAVTIATGRTHQIRVHMAHIGHPLLGDPIYGSGGSAECGSGAPASCGHGSLPPIGRAALHAWRVEFDQPFTGERIILEAPLPDDFRGLLMKSGGRGSVLPHPPEDAGAG